MLILVRHAMPSHGPQTPAHEWELGADGHTAAHRLAAALPNSALLVASAEPKVQTLAPAGTTLRDSRLNEVTRVEPWEGEYLRLRREYVSGTDHADWEPRAAVAARFEAAVREHLASAQGKPLIIATHGMAMTIWLTSHQLLGDPATFWSELRFPDAHIVERDTQPGTARHRHSTPRGHTGHTGYTGYTGYSKLTNRGVSRATLGRFTALAVIV
jgi:broad specificity phosphatase PhoE